MSLRDLVPNSRVPMSFLRRLCPWLVLAALFALIFARVPLEKVYLALFQVQILPFIAWSALFILILAGYDSIVLWFAFSRLHHPMPWRDVFYARGARELLNSLATVAGQAGMGYWLHRKEKVPLRQAASTTFFLLYLEIYSLLVIPTILLLVLPEYGPSLIFQSSLAGRSLQFLILAWLAFAAALIFWKKSGPNPLQRLADRLGLWSSFHQASLRDWILILFAKTLLQAILNGVILLTLSAARLEIPATLVFIFFPLISVLGSIPITPARLGTVQLGFILFLRQAADPADLVAFSLLWQFISNACRWIFGAFFLPRLLRDLRSQGESGES